MSCPSTVILLLCIKQEQRWQCLHNPPTQSSSFGEPTRPTPQTGDFDNHLEPVGRDSTQEKGPTGPFPESGPGVVNAAHLSRAGHRAGTLAPTNLPRRPLQWLPLRHFPEGASPTAPSGHRPSRAERRRLQSWLGSCQSGSPPDELTVPLKPVPQPLAWPGPALTDHRLPSPGVSGTAHLSPAPGSDRIVSSLPGCQGRRGRLPAGPPWRTTPADHPNLTHPHLPSAAQGPGRRPPSLLLSSPLAAPHLDSHRFPRDPNGKDESRPPRLCTKLGQWEKLVVLPSL
nr:basic salivary proline-rich protein 1-like [Macaca fascicularis]